MQELKEVFASYSKDVVDFKKLVLNISEVVVKNLKIEEYFNGFNLFSGKVQSSYNSSTKQILLNPECILNDSLETAKAEFVPEEDMYGFVCGYIANVLLYNFGMAKNFSYTKTNENSLLVKMLKAENFENQKSNKDPKLLRNYVNFRLQYNHLFPFNRVAHYFALKSTLMMLEDTPYEKIKEYMKDEFLNILVVPYMLGLSPIEMIKQAYNLEVYSFNDIENKRIKKQFLDFEGLPFYDEDSLIMQRKMLEYPLEERFKLGLYVSNEETEEIVRKLVL